ncbi:myb-like dna-binding domain containing protein [Stylonychia lemnae]|uniref:Myb-like dna-binding domain containing protein n=1 Tax=Stylonychia lemnae TaxID=5949 RepID=A0A078AD12_STYLE|nr:myb-like dna-binding domain containing protein [Stylonychia lemnae]|eukprot:CDW79741.1 myb-like dna-binding domain containing protein [Stylonychia lemnae]
MQGPKKENKRIIKNHEENQPENVTPFPDSVDNDKDSKSSLNEKSGTNLTPFSSILSQFQKIQAKMMKIRVFYNENAKHHRENSGLNQYFQYIKFLKEDEAIEQLVDKYGTKRWTFIAQKLKDEFSIGGRTGKQCRERWHNHLDPEIKKDPITPEEERLIFESHKMYGNKWADIAKLMPGRSDNTRKLGIKVKNLTAEHLYQLVKEHQLNYDQIKDLEPKRFQDLEYTMKLIFNHDEDQNRKIEKGDQEIESNYEAQIKKDSDIENPEMEQSSERLKQASSAFLLLSSRRSQRLQRKKRLNYEDLNDHPEQIKKQLTSIKEYNLAPSLKRKKFLTDETISDKQYPLQSSSENKTPDQQTSIVGIDEQFSQFKSLEKQQLNEDRIEEQTSESQQRKLSFGDQNLEHKIFNPKIISINPSTKQQFKIEPKSFNQELRTPQKIGIPNLTPISYSKLPQFQTPQQGYQAKHQHQHVIVEQSPSQQIIYQFGDGNQMTSPLYIPIQNNNYQLFKSPRFQLQFTSDQTKKEISGRKISEQQNFEEDKKGEEVSKLDLDKSLNQQSLLTVKPQIKHNISIQADQMQPQYLIVPIYQQQMYYPDMNTKLTVQKIQSSNNNVTQDQKQIKEVNQNVDLD